MGKVIIQCDFCEAPVIATYSVEVQRVSPVGVRWQICQLRVCEEHELDFEDDPGAAIQAKLNQ